MKLTAFLRIVFSSFVIFIIYLYWSFRSANYTHIIMKNVTTYNNYDAQPNNVIVHNDNNNFNSRYREIYLAVVACGDRIKEALTMLKSALMFTKAHINIIIFCEDDLMLDFKEKRFLVPIEPFCNPSKSEINGKTQSSAETAVKRHRFDASGDADGENTCNQSSSSGGYKNNEQRQNLYQGVVNKNDVGNFIDSKLSDTQKLDLLTNAWVPPKNYGFPLLQKFEARKLKFCHKWLDEFSWLAYSELHHGAFCVPCVAFARSVGKGSQPLGQLVKAKFDNWKKAKELSEWKTLTNEAFSYEILPLKFPKENPGEWRRLFKQCAAQRLFLPSLLPHIDSVLYVDTDTLFLTDLDTIWEHFYKMNSTQMAALAPETEDPNIGWYNRFAKHPYYGKLGVNSGVLLMNLTKMREFKWTEYVVPIYKKYKLKITFGDQDIINIIFHYHPDKLYIYPCQYNFRPDHCMYMSICKSAEKDGVMVLHGSRGFFHSEKQPVFQVIYRAFEEYQIGQDLQQNFMLPLESYLETTTDSNCGYVRHIFLKNVQKFINIHDIT